MSSHPRPALARIMDRISRFVYLKMMALIPLIPNRRLADGYFRAMGFEDVYCDGPYPHFFSGIMSKGGFNAYAVKFLEKTPEGREILGQIQEAFAKRGKRDHVETRRRGEKDG